MRLSEAELQEAHGRLAAQELGARELDAAGAPCPGPDVLEAFLLDELPPEEREQLAGHLEACASCATLVQEVGSLSAWAETAAATSAAPLSSEEHSPGPVRTGSRVRPGWAALAASLLLAVVGGAWWLGAGERPPTAETFRGPAAAALVPADGAALEQLPAAFDWPDQPGAESYRLILLSASGETLWQSGELSASTGSLPAAGRAGLEAGAYAWLVEVRGPAPRSELGPYRFRVAAMGETAGGPLDGSR